MITVCREKMCNGCMLCANICPCKAISIIDKHDSYDAVINQKVCTNCNLCRNHCPNNIDLPFLRPIIWKQGWAQSEKTREKGSSGGIAGAIEKRFVESNGIVCSCIYKNGCYEFEFSNNLIDTDLYCGSKYIKSNPTGIYSVIRKLINEGKEVLFVGLPCQVAAVISYCGKKENLYTIDLICHGTPSPFVFNKFVKKRIQRGNTIVNNLSFRKKTRLGIHINNEQISMDYYMDLFLHCDSYTENCYYCKFAKPERVSDVTIGDSWGSDFDISEKQRGISLILVQSEKGKELIEKADLVLFSVNPKRAMDNNLQLQHPSSPGKRRRLLFFWLNRKVPFSLTYFLCYPERFCVLLVKKLKNKLSKFGHNRLRFFS